MYFEPIITYLIWPVLIVISYYLIRFVIIRLEKRDF